jgi:aminopeptidase-like protein
VLSSEFLQRYLERLFPINRSLTGKGNLETLEILKEIVPELKIRFAKSGTKAFDWRVPNEWHVDWAYIKDSQGNTILNFKDLNLSLVSYSQSFEGWVTKEQLLAHLHTTEMFSDATPYVTSYYRLYWGFCVTQEFLSKLIDEKYFVSISTRSFKGKMHYGEIFIPGKSPSEVLVSTYICHPSMANNELSGPLVAIALAEELMGKKMSLQKSYRFIFVPETIGSLFYISRNLKKLKKRVISTFVLTCIGDNREWSYLMSRYGDTLADKVTRFAFDQQKIKYLQYDYLSRGSDERQFGSPAVDIPVVSIMRSKYGTFKEYHTSKDNLDLVNGANLKESAEFVMMVLSILDRNVRPIVNVKGEPFFMKRNLRSQNFNNLSLGERDSNMSNFLAYCDGKNDLVDICEIINVDFEEAYAHYVNLLNEGLIRTM